MKNSPIKSRVGRAALGGCALIAATFYATTHAHGAGPRPLFQATFPCGQVWDASTYEGHEAQNNAIDLAEWKDKKVTSMGQPVLASAAGTVKSSYIRKSDGEYRIFIDHGGGWETHYIHMQVGDGNLMKVGRRVAQGEQIGRTGDSGSPTIHQHYSQFRDGKGVRIRLNGAAIKTHAGNQASYGTWGKSNAEKIISLNCAGNSFMGWNDGGLRYHLIYKPGTGETKIVRTSTNGSTKSTWAGKWTLGWTHFLPFYLKTGGHPHAIVYKSASGRVGFLRLKLKGGGVTKLKFGTWGKGWTHLVPFNLGGTPHLLAYDSVQGYAAIDRIHPTGDGTTPIYKKTWIKGRTQIVPFKLGPRQYLLLYKGGSGAVKIVKITGSGKSVGTSDAWSDKWSTGYTNIVAVTHEGARYLLAYKAATGAAKILKLKPGGKGVSTVSSMSWTKPWTAFSPLRIDGKGHFLVYKIGTGEIKTLRLKAGGKGVQTIRTDSWTWGWK